MLSDRQSVEVFHLLFLRALATRVDPSLYVLKGGCNLRFFCKSIRYSEAMDLDVHTIAVTTLRRNVEHVFESTGFRQTLGAHGLELTDFTAPKQTATTQRWKARIRAGGGELPTKIEFSRRRAAGEAAYEAVDPEIIRRYRLYPVLATHYTLSTAFEQKLAALGGRATPQARDLFDLKLLLDAGAQSGAPASLKIPAKAMDNAMSIGYDEFAAQVLAFLEPDYQQYYRSRAVWDTLQESVVNTLEALR